LCLYPLSGKELVISVIQLQHLTKLYGNTIGIKHLNLAVEKTEIFGFLGPNGAGKTTTIRLLLDLLRPTSGQISVFNESLPDRSAQIRSKCGYLPGDFKAFDHMSVMDFLNFIASVRQLSNPDYSLIERFQLDKERLKKIKHLSHGTRQKLGIIQAFFHHPDLVILDEPTTGLDPLMKNEFYDFLFDYQKNEKTVFLSSHDLSEVERICQRVAIIREGELVALESIDNLKRNRYRRLKLTLSRPMNQLNIPNSSLVNKNKLDYEFIFKGDIPQLLKILVDLPIQDFYFPEPDLEEVFMYYYEEHKDV
jgi:ABC-2 type transport system ATP-binding protein